MLTCASFFAGVGGIDMGFESAGFKTVYANEFDPYPVKTFEENFDIKVDNRDIHDVKSNEIPDFDVMLAGFPCLTGNTLVLTDKGYKKIVDVTNEDMVLSHDRKMHKVLRFMNQGKKNTYEIKATGIYNLEATGNHKFYVSKCERVWDNNKRSYGRVLHTAEWKTVDEIVESDDQYYLGCPINNNSTYPMWNGVDVYVNATTKKRIKSLDMECEDLWYLVGRYLGDGWLRKQYKKGNKRSKYTGVVICCNHEKLEHLKHRIGKLFNFSVAVEKSINKIHITNMEFAHFISQFGEYAGSKFLPGFVYDLPDSALKELINGYFDSDGHLDKDGKHKVITSINLGLLYGIEYCIQKVYKTACNIHKMDSGRFREIEGRIVLTQDTYRLTFCEEKVKRQHAIYHNDYMWYPIKTIEPIGEQAVYDIEVDETHSFVANNCVTHNCQAFSIAGYRQGFDDEKGRGELFFELTRILEDKRPRVAFFENVKNLVGHDNGNTFRVICEQLDILGYKYTYQVLNAMHYGNVAQNRERIYIVAFRDAEDYERFSWPLSEPLTHTVKDIIDFDNKVDEKYYYTEGKYKGNIYDELVKAMRNDDPQNPAIYQWRRKYVRKNQSGVVPTLTANQGEGGHNVCLIKTKYGIRKMTPRECFNTQGFPKEFKLPEDMSDGRLYKQAGNSVCVSVIARIAEKVAEATK